MIVLIGVSVPFHQVGISERDVCAEVLPSHKMEKVASFQQGHVKVRS